MDVQASSRLVFVLVYVLRFLACKADNLDTYHASATAHSGSLSASEKASTPDEMYGSFNDPGTWVWFLVMQLFAANVNATFPAPVIPEAIFPRFVPSTDLYKLHPCKRSDLFKCVHYGEMFMPKKLDH